jgi:hypothetical protein
MLLFYEDCLAYNAVAERWNVMALLSPNYENSK